MLTPDPINTGQLRVIANILGGQQLKPWAALVGAAADEIDRLRAASPPEAIVLVCPEIDAEYSADVHAFGDIGAAEDFELDVEEPAVLYYVRSWTRHERGGGERCTKPG